MNLYKRIFCESDERTRQLARRAAVDPDETTQLAYRRALERSGVSANYDRSVEALDRQSEAARPVVDTLISSVEPGVRFGTPRELRALARTHGIPMFHLTSHLLAHQRSGHVRYDPRHLAWYKTEHQTEAFEFISNLFSRNKPKKTEPNEPPPQAPLADRIKQWETRREELYKQAQDTEARRQKLRAGDLRVAALTGNPPRKPLPRTPLTGLMLPKRDEI